MVNDHERETINRGDKKESRACETINEGEASEIRTSSGQRQGREA